MHLHDAVSKRSEIPNHDAFVIQCADEQAVDSFSSLNGSYNVEPMLGPGTGIVLHPGTSLTERLSIARLHSPIEMYRLKYGYGGREALLSTMRTGTTIPDGPCYAGITRFVNRMKELIRTGEYDERDKWHAARNVMTMTSRFVIPHHDNGNVTEEPTPEQYESLGVTLGGLAGMPGYDARYLLLRKNVNWYTFNAVLDTVLPRGNGRHWTVSEPEDEKYVNTLRDMAVDARIAATYVKDNLPQRKNNRTGDRRGDRPRHDLRELDQAIATTDGVLDDFYRNRAEYRDAPVELAVEDMLDGLTEAGATGAVNRLAAEALDNEEQRFEQKRGKSSSESRNAYAYDISCMSLHTNLMLDDGLRARFAGHVGKTT